jgi:hypothetical protein
MDGMAPFSCRPVKIRLPFQKFAFDIKINYSLTISVINNQHSLERMELTGKSSVFTIQKPDNEKEVRQFRLYF